MYPMFNFIKATLSYCDHHGNQLLYFKVRLILGIFRKSRLSVISIIMFNSSSKNMYKLPQPVYIIGLLLTNLYNRPVYPIYLLCIQMKPLIPTLAVMISALLVTIFSTTLNIANANSNELQDNPLPFLPQFQHSHSQLQPSQQQPQHQQQQQMSQPTQKQPLNTNEMSDSHNNKLDNHSRMGNSGQN